MTHKLSSIYILLSISWVFPHSLSRSLLIPFTCLLSMASPSHLSISWLLWFRRGKKGQWHFFRGGSNGVSGWVRSLPFPAQVPERTLKRVSDSQSVRPIAPSPPPPIRTSFNQLDQSDHSTPLVSVSLESRGGDTPLSRELYSDEKREWSYQVVSRFMDRLDPLFLVTTAEFPSLATLREDNHRVLGFAWEKVREKSTKYRRRVRDGEGGERQEEEGSSTR